MADIVSYSGIGLYPPFVRDVINAAWNEGTAKANAFGVKINDIEAAIATPGIVADITADVATGATVTEPAVDIPASADVTDVMGMFDTKYLELVALLSTKFTDFRAAYFPDDSAAYAQVEDWLQAGLANDSGLPAATRAQLMTDSTDRLVADGVRATDAVLQTFAARRFPLPPGAAAGAALQIAQKVQDGISEASLKLTVASVEQLKWNVDKLIGLRQLAMSSAVEYIKALASGPEMASRLVGIGYDAQSKLISAASQFYGVRAEVAKMTNQVSQFNVTTALQADEKNQAVDMMLVETRLKALLSEAQAIAQMATSLFNNIHASAGVSASDSVSTSL
ncbi:MAG: hypothetical protein WC023_01410 [Rhodocyclaceae bacterium]